MTGCNGKSKLDPDKPATWKPSSVTCEVFEVLLKILHTSRIAKKPKPYLRISMLPKWVKDLCLADIDEVLRLMNGTTFCHPDRFCDAVTVEVLTAMRTAMKKLKSRARAVAVSTGVVNS